MSHVEIGQKLAHYEILAKIGEGGMGEVYRAHDTKLGRDVALKVLPPEVGSNKTRRARFEREAKAVAALNHPNIITLHAIEESDDIRFITMELVDGETLTDLIPREGMATGQLLDLAVPIVDAIQAAHEQGITHRDLKPLNIVVTKDGRPKVLDFGLAKQVIRTKKLDAHEDTLVRTAEGVIVGTVSYMSPEQALGEDVDQRSDIFSLGIVLYEMLTGRRPFQGKTSTQLLDKLIHAEPEPMDSAGDVVGTELVRIISKCLQKDRERRYQTARDMRVDLDNLRSSGSQPRLVTPSATPAPSRPPWMAIAALVAILVVAAVVFSVLRKPASAETPSAIESVAVLPFSNDTGNPENDYLGEGIAESVIHALSQESELRVISRTSAFRFREDSSLAEIESQLGVKTVVLGRIGIRGDQVRISAELVDLPDGTQVWGDSFNRPSSDLLSLESELAATIAQQLLGRLTSTPSEVITQRQPQDPEAYRLYLQARQFHTGTSRDMEKSADLLRQAIEIDPDYALAWASLAEIRAIQSLYGLTDPTAGFAEMSQAAKTAVGLDPDLAEAHTVSAMVKFYLEWDREAADQEFRRAIELSPGSPLAYVEYAEFLFALGRADEAIEVSKKILEVDPLSSRGPHGQGIGYLLKGDYDKAADFFQRALDTNPSWTWGYVKKSVATAKAGRCEESAPLIAIAEERLGDRVNPLAHSWLGGAYAICGNTEAAKAKIDLIEGYEKEWYVDPINAAAIHAALGDKETALALLEKTYERHSAFLVYAKAYALLWMPELNDDPRFVDLLERVGLPTEG